MSKDEAINTLKYNIYQTKVTGFFPLPQKAKQKPFYGKVKNNDFKVYLTSNFNSYLYAGIKGQIENSSNGTEINIFTRGASAFLLLIQVVCSLFIAYIGFTFAMASTLPLLSILFLALSCLVIVWTFINSFLSSRNYIKKATQIIREIFN